MSAQPIEHIGFWTEEQYLALGEDQGNRVELLDGSLLVSPWPNGRHQQFARRLANLLVAAGSTGVSVIESVNLRVARGRMFGPDVVVTRERDDLDVYQANHVVLVAEVVSPHGRRRDLVLKYGTYAAAGIPRYLIVETGDGGEPVVSLHVLHGDTYVEVGRARPGQVLRVDEPRLDLHPADLLHG